MVMKNNLKNLALEIQNCDKVHRRKSSKLGLLIDGRFLDVEQNVLSLSDNSNLPTYCFRVYTKGEIATSFIDSVVIYKQI